MANIKVFNPVTQKWEVQHTRLASGIKVLDVAGNFNKEDPDIIDLDVETCLAEVKQDIAAVKKDIEYIYQNGTIGGGGGGGSSHLPTLKLDSEASVIARTDEQIKIYYVASSPTGGILKIDYTLYNTDLNSVVDSGIVNVKMGKNIMTFGPLEKGLYRASFMAEDSAGFISNSIEVEIVVGALELNTKYPSSSDVTLADDITIPYNVVSAFTDGVTATLTIDGISRTEAVNIGANFFRIGRFESYGVHSASVVASNGKVTSNELFFNFIVTDTNNLFISSEFKTGAIYEIGKTVSIDYRLSMFGESKFKVFRSINGVSQPVETKGKDTYYWNMDGLEAGDYRVKIYATTLDEAIKSNELDFSFTVVVNEYIPMKPITRNLEVHLEAYNKSQNAADRNVWKNMVDDSPICTLYNFNYKTNGWMDNALTFNGRTYAEVNYRPLADNALHGCTIDVLCKIENVGDVDAFVVFVKNMMTPYQGMAISTELATLTSWDSKTVDTNFQDNTYTRFTFVIDREKQLLLLYINGILSKAVDIPVNDRYEFDQTLLLGAGRDADGNIVHNSSSAIRTLKIYKTALTKEEILQNYIADIKDQEHQTLLRTLNGIKIDNSGAVIFEPVSMPTLRMTGNVNSMTDVNEVPLRLVFTDTYDQNNNFALDQCMIMWQGTSSRAYPVKNYTLKLRKGGDDFYYAPRPGWKPEYRYTLKADFMESSHSNNTGTARYVTDMLKYNPNPAQQKDPEAKIAIEAFPIQLYINDEYMGIYNWCIDRYSHNNYGLLNEQRALQYEVSTNSSDGAGAFWSEEWEKIRIEFKYRYHYAGGEDVVCERLPNEEIVLRDIGGYHDELKRLIKWVKNCTDGEFEAELAEHFDVNSLIDYYLIVYVLGLIDSYGKNMVLTTWGRNVQGHTIWWLSYYDLDSGLGLTNDGKFTIQPDADIGGRWPGDSGDYNTSNSALWTKLRNNKTFANRIADRYRQLRDEGWFSAEKFLQYYEEQTINQLGQRYFNEDAHVKYIDRNERKWIHLALGTRLEATRRWLRERFIYLDSIYEYGEYLKFGIMRSNVYGKVILGIKTYSPMMLKVKMTSAAVMKQYVSRNNSGTRDGYYEFEYTFTNDHDNEITIYGAPHIMTFRSLEDLYLSSFEMGEAHRLTEVVCRNSNYLVRLELSNNRMLQKLDVYNCKKLGSVTQYSTLNLENCLYLRHVNAGGTKIGSIMLNKTGGVLDFLNLNGTYIRDFTLVGQEYLSDMDIRDCIDLSTVRIEGCNALTAIEIPNSKISEFRVVDCDNVTKIDVSRTGYLRLLDLTGCPNLLDLNMSNTANPAIKEIDLRISEKLTKLDISGCTALNGVWLSENATHISNLNVAGSAIKYFRFGREAQPTYLDLSRFNIENISFNNCAHVEEIRNANIGRTTYVSGAVFKGCANLHTITGYLRMGGSIGQAFYGCAKLINLPAQFLLNEVTSTSETFMGCKSFTITTAKNIMAKLVNLNGGTWRLFNGCTGIISNDANPFPADFYDKAIKLTNLDRIFEGCTNIRGPFPYGIYKNLVDLNRLTYPFNGCTFVSTDNVLMDDVFKNNINLQTLQFPFAGIRLDDAPTKKLLENATKLVNVDGLFSGQSSMYSVHTDYFIDPDFFYKNLNLNNVTNAFNGCTRLDQAIPPGLFRNNRKISDAAYLLRNCSNIRGTIPEDFFPANVDGSGVDTSVLKNINGLFQNCSGLTGGIPNSLLLKHKNLIYAKYTFAGCTGIGMELGSIPSNIFHNKFLLQEIEGFFQGCSNMIFDLPEGMFKDSTALTNISFLFDGCKRLSGVIPDGFFDCRNAAGEVVNNRILYAEAVFRNCNEIGGRIPEDLFSKFREVTSLKEFFMNCWNIRGSIPKRLFYECRNVTNLEGFISCPWDGAYPNLFGTDKLPTEDDVDYGEYLMHPSTFSRCYNLKTTANMFYGCRNFTGKLHEDTFKGLTFLENTARMFTASGCSGDITRATFGTNIELKNMEEMFYSANLNSITPDSLRDVVHTKLTGLAGTFRGQSNMTGEAPRVWITHTAASKQYCFSGCTRLDNYNDIPAQWGGPADAATISE